MGNSTISLQDVLDWTAAKGLPVPTQSAAGYGTDLVLRIANKVMAMIIAERFNWKWNRIVAAPFYTNSFQQDYPQLELTGVGWLEDCDRVDINNTAYPKPKINITVRKQLSSSSLPWQPPCEICWMYNSDMNYGSWAAGATFYPLVAPLAKQNPLMAIVDPNGNLQIMASFTNTGSDVAVTTGLTAPAWPTANAAEGTATTDGTVTWKVVSPNSMGFRVFPLPGGVGPCYQMIPIYQQVAQAIATLQTMLSPIPDDYSHYFEDGFEAYCLQASPDPRDKAKFQDAFKIWMGSMEKAKQQGDRELNAYGMLPATQCVESLWNGMRNPQDPSQPY